MRFANEAEAITYVFRSLRKLRGVDRGPDELSRNTAPTHRLLQRTGLLAAHADGRNVVREYAVVTGSKGKGSTTVITAKLLQHLGHTVGMITSPHLASWRERIRVNGRAIPEADLIRILDELAPEIDAIEATLSDEQYFSPQGIFLAIALRWFDENAVNAAVLEVGRGGRFDDIAVVQQSALAVHADHAGAPAPIGTDLATDRMAQSRDHQGEQLRLQRSAADRGARSAASGSRHA